MTQRESGQLFLDKIRMGHKISAIKILRDHAHSAPSLCDSKEFTEGVMDCMLGQQPVANELVELRHRCQVLTGIITQLLEALNR